MISQWENGTRDPGTEILKKLAAYFNVSVDYLLGEDNPPTNKKIPKDLKKILEDEEVTLNGRMLSEVSKYAGFKHFKVLLHPNCTHKNAVLTII